MGWYDLHIVCLHHLASWSLDRAAREGTRRALRPERPPAVSVSYLESAWFGGPAECHTSLVGREIVPSGSGRQRIEQQHDYQSSFATARDQRGLELRTDAASTFSIVKEPA